MKLLRVFSALLVILTLAVVGRYAYSRFIQGEDTGLHGAVNQTKKDLLSLGGAVNTELTKVLGESDTNSGIASYVRNDLPAKVEERLKQSALVSDIQEEINGFMKDSSEEIKDIPKTQAEKLKKNVTQEICSQLLKEEQEATDSAGD